MKIRAVCLLFGLMLLLSGCVDPAARAEPATPPSLEEPVVEETPPPVAAPPAVEETAPPVELPVTTVVVPEPRPAPPESGTKMTLDGQGLTVYDVKNRDVPMLAVADFARAAGGAMDAADRVLDPSCTLMVGEQTLTFTQEDGYLDDQGNWYAPCEVLLATLTLQTFYDEAEDHWYYTTDLPASEVPAGYKVPVIMYHAVSDEIWGYEGLFVSPAQMEEHLQYLQDNGFTPIWFEDLPNVDQYEKPIILTFDDGYDDNYTELYPILEKYQAKATIFVITQRLGTEHKMTAEQVRELSQTGLISIQSHTATHPRLGELTAEEQEREMRQAQLDIARLTGKVPRVIAYPEGRYNQDTFAVGAKYYDYGLLMEGWCYYTGQHPMEIYRYAAMRHTNMWTYADMCAGK